MAREVAAALQLDTTPTGDTLSHVSRLGIAHGRLERESLRFVADEGEDLEIEATWFVSDDWDGPLVIGWKGCLERMRFAFDPIAGRNTFHFSDPEDEPLP